MNIQKNIYFFGGGGGGSGWGCQDGCERRSEAFAKIQINKKKIPHMKFQDSIFNGLKVTVSTKSVTHTRTHAHKHAPKAICPINFFKVGGIIILIL